MKRLLTILIMMSLSFFYGAAFIKYEVFPYQEVLSVYKQLTYIEKEVPLKAAALEESQGYVESNLMPLTYLEFDFSVDAPQTTTDGAISYVNNSLIMLNRAREISVFNLSSKQSSKLQLPPIIDNNSDYLLSEINNLKKDLRFYDIFVRETDAHLELYLSHELFFPGTKYQTIAVSMIRLDNNFKNITNWTKIFEGTKTIYPGGLPSCGGGKIESYQNFLYLSYGDCVLDNWQNNIFPEEIPPAQNMDSTLGKIIKINLKNSKASVYSSGHRNPQGLYINEEGLIFETEHGPNGGDEVNLIKENLNYGWPIESLGINYTDFYAPVKNVPGSHELYELPIFSFLPSIGISNILQIKNFSDRWDGDLLVGSLKARSLYRLRMDSERIIYSEPIYIGERVRDIEQNNNLIFLWLNSQKLRIYSSDESLYSLEGTGNIITLDPLLNSCLRCHHVGVTNESHFAPSLSGIFDRGIGSDPGFVGYSTDLKNSSSTWTKEKIADFIKKPQKSYPSSIMPASQNIQDYQIDIIVNQLEAMSFKKPSSSQ